MRKARASAVLLLLLLGCNDRSSKVDAAPAAPQDDQSKLDALVRDNLDAELSESPTLATWLGAHGQDDRLDDVRLDAQIREAARWKLVLERVRAIPEDRLDAPRRVDRLLLMRRAEAAIQERTDLRPLERNPAVYIDLGQSAIFDLVAQGPPSPDRLRLVTVRLWKLRPLFDEARRNLRGSLVADLNVRRAIELGQSFKGFLQETLPRVVQIEGSGKLMEDFRNADGDASRALDDFIAWLQKDLAPRARGDFAMGREKLMERLRVTEGIELTPELLLSVAEAEVKEARRRVDEAEKAALLGKPGDVNKLIEEDHGKPDDVLRDAQASAARIMDLLSRDKLVPGASTRPVVTDMPPAMWGFVQLNMAGPLERARDAYLYVEPIAKGWPERRKQEHLRNFNRPTMVLTLAHDIARYQAAERNRRAPTTMQKLALAGTFMSGWPHYAERMLIDAGLGDGDLRLRVVAERAALTRAARMVAALKLHAFGAKLEDATRIFTDSVGLDEYPARREAERAAADPMVMADTLGRLAIEHLRDDWRASHADATLGAFHDALLAHGSPPIAILRKILLPDDRRSPL